MTEGLIASSAAEGSGSRRRGFKTQTEFSTGATAEGERYIESPLQRLQRLRAETKQFLDDVEAVSKETKAPVDQGVSAQELAAELKTTLAQLDAQLQNERLQHVRKIALDRRHRAAIGQTLKDTCTHYLLAQSPRSHHTGEYDVRIS